MTDPQEIANLLERLYGREKARRAFEMISDVLLRFGSRAQKSRKSLSSRDAIVITYADTLQGGGGSPAQTLNTFSRQWLTECFSAVHLLPFYPYSSDDGFSVKDYLAVNPAVGTWQDIERLGECFDLMFDYVLNHISAESDWFKHYLDQKPGFSDLAIEVAPGTDLSLVTRPRALPLLTPFRLADGREVLVWTTFSADQVDLNYHSVDVLIKMIAVLLAYVQKGARFVRLDAVAYLWKTVGTPCIHLEKTHLVVKLLRKVLDWAAPDTVIVTETNVPHAENISYFGDGHDEAQMVYNFTLPPLLLHTFYNADCSVLNDWARSLRTPSAKTAFFNFTASHDGIGVRPAEGILSQQALLQLVEGTLARGGRVSYKSNPDGSKSPYELNITYVDALGGKDDAGTPRHAARFIASQAIALVLPGVPGIYLPGLLGSRNWQQGVAMTGRARSINRQKLEVQALTAELNDRHHFRSLVFHPLQRMLALRRRQPAFDPQAAGKVMILDKRVFGMQRTCAAHRLWTFVNVSDQSLVVSVPDAGPKMDAEDLLSGKALKLAKVFLAPYQVRWLSMLKDSAAVDFIP